MNKGMLTARYNRKTEKYDNTVTQKRPEIDYGFTPYKLRSRSWVVVNHVSKANNYDIVNYSEKMYRLQVKYNTSDFRYIMEQERAKKVLKSYHKYTIKELMDMITNENENIIMQAIERIIDDERKTERKRLQTIAEQKAKEEEFTEKVRMQTKMRNIKIMSGLACCPNYDRIYA